MKSIKILSILLVLLVVSSCRYDLNIGQTDGNGNVIIEERYQGVAFNEVSGATGLDVYLTEGNETKVEVEADENLQELIITEIRDGKLKIRTSTNIGSAESKKVHVTFTNLNGVSASSGADVIGNSVIRSERLNLEASSGADLEVEVFAKNIYAETSSGADMKISGQASSLSADASSGSDLDAKDLYVATCNAEASSGAEVTVNVKDKLTADASSGGDINYLGEPSVINNNSSSSGKLHKH